MSTDFKVPEGYVLVKIEPCDSELACMKSAVGDMENGIALHIRHMVEARREVITWAQVEAKMRAARNHQQ